jgi:hypothetical protein
MAISEFLVVRVHVGLAAFSGKPAYGNSNVAIPAGGKRGKTLSAAPPTPDRNSQRHGRYSFDQAISRASRRR